MSQGPLGLDLAVVGGQEAEHPGTSWWPLHWLWVEAGSAGPWRSLRPGNFSGEEKGGWLPVAPSIPSYPHPTKRD